MSNENKHNLYIVMEKYTKKMGTATHSMYPLHKDRPWYVVLEGEDGKDVSWSTLVTEYLLIVPEEI